MLSRFCWKHAASRRSGYLDDRTIVMSYGNF
jgi:hypothetical protein